MASMNDMPDEMIDTICQDLYRRKDYQSLYHFVQTGRRAHEICQRYLDKVNRKIVIMISSVGERHEDSTPVALITLDKFKKFLKKADYYGYQFYITVIIPNKRISDEGDLNMTFVDDDPGENAVYLNDIAFIWDDFESYMKMIDIITAIYDKRITDKDEY